MARRLEVRDCGGDQHSRWCNLLGDQWGCIPMGRLAGALVLDWVNGRYRGRFDPRALSRRRSNCHRPPVYLATAAELAVAPEPAQRMLAIDRLPSRRPGEPDRSAAS